MRMSRGMKRRTGGIFRSGRGSTSGESCLTLADARPGGNYRIRKIIGGCRMNCRLCALGLMPNETFNVYAASRGGPFCISVKGSKFAVGRGMADRIVIEELQ